MQAGALSGRAVAKRSTDSIARIGVRSVAMLLPHTDVRGAKQLANLWHQTVTQALCEQGIASAAGVYCGAATAGGRRNPTVDACRLEAGAHNAVYWASALGHSVLHLDDLQALLTPGSTDPDPDRADAEVAA